MHIEVQVALNFVISYLYNKLPRRRVNIFGEELEKALKDKFQGHWYPEKPFKVSISDNISLFSHSSSTIVIRWIWILNVVCGLKFSAYCDALDHAKGGGL